LSIVASTPFALHWSRKVNRKLASSAVSNLNLEPSNGDDRPRINEARNSGLEEVEGAAWLMLSAVWGQGAIVQTRNRKGVISERKIEMSSTVPDKLRFIDFETSTAAMVDKHQLLARRLDASWPGTKLLALQMRYAALALGVGDLTIRMPKRKDYKEPIWDHVGGMLIYEEAGGIITDMDGRLFGFGTATRLTGNRGIVAARKEIHGKSSRDGKRNIRSSSKWEWLRNYVAFASKTLLHWIR
jgi:hypothetical protein